MQVVEILFYFFFFFGGGGGVPNKKADNKRQSVEKSAKTNHATIP